MKKSKILKALKPIAKYLVGAGITVAVAIVLLIVFSGKGADKISATSTLKELRVAEELLVVNYTYNSIVAVPNENDPRYSVSYKGSVKAGYDFDEIVIEEDGTNITVIIPLIEIMEVFIDGGSMDYIFKDQKYNTETTYEEAYNACVNDLRAKAECNETLHKEAKDYAIETMKGLVKPLVESWGEEYTVSVVYAGDLSNTEEAE